MTGQDGMKYILCCGGGTVQKEDLDNNFIEECVTYHPEN